MCPDLALHDMSRPDCRKQACVEEPDLHSTNLAENGFTNTATLVMQGRAVEECKEQVSTVLQQLQQDYPEVAVRVVSHTGRVSL